MAFTYDFNSAPQLSQVRMLIADTDSTHPIFSDDEVNQALTLQSSAGIYASGQFFTGAFAPAIGPIVYSVYRSAALLLDSLAANKSRLSSVIELLDVKLAPEKAAQELRATAKEYRDIECNNGSFAIAEWNINQFTARERIWKVLLRMEGV
jgi:hypothetical protein